MQFVADGPDVPEELLQAHEEEKVVFFCGAGISYPAGLPGFRGLVESIYELSGTEKDEIEQQAFDSEKYNATLDLLERRMPGQRGTRPTGSGEACISRGIGGGQKFCVRA